MDVVIIPTWEQINGMVVLLALVLIGIGIGLWWNKHHGDRYVEWVRDWEEYK